MNKKKIEKKSIKIWIIQNLFLSLQSEKTKNLIKLIDNGKFYL